MSTSPKFEKTTPDSAPAAKPHLVQNNCTTEFQQLFTGAVERVAEMQKECLEAAAQHSAEMMESYKKLVPMAPATPAAYDLTKQAFDSYIEIQKSMIDLLAERATAFTDIATQCGTPNSIVAELTTKVQESVDRVLAAHNKMVEVSVRQMDAVRDFAIGLLPASEQQWRQEVLRRSAHNAKD